MIGCGQYSEVDDWAAGEAVTVNIAAIAVKGTRLTDPGLVVGKVARQTSSVAEVIRSEVVVGFTGCTISGGSA